MAALATPLCAVKHCSVAIIELFTALIRKLTDANRQCFNCLECFNIYRQSGRHGVLLDNRLAIANQC